MSKQRVSSGLLLSLGLAFVFGYAAIASLMHPFEWVGYVPTLLTKFATPTTLVKLIAFYELVLTAWLVWGKYRKYAAALSALTLAGIIVFNWSEMIITFRDVGLVFMAVALLVEAW